MRSKLSQSDLDARNAEWARLRVEGHGPKHISLMFGVPYSTVWNALNRMNLVENRKGESLETRIRKQNEECRRYYRQNRKSILEKVRLKRAANPQAHRDAVRRSILKNPDVAANRQRRWVDMNREQVRSYRRAYYLKNIDKFRQLKRLSKLRNRDRNNARQRARLSNDVLFRIQAKLRSRLAVALKKCKHNKLKPTSRTVSAVRDLGCTIAELKQWIESQFTHEMSWENHGTVWQLDHRLAFSDCDLTDELQVRSVVHYTNLQPLLKFDNLSKGGANRRRHSAKAG